MEIIKEKILTDWGGIAIIRSNSYGSNLAHFQRLFAAAKEDFPDLEPQRAEFVKYGGVSYARTYGIEFGFEGQGPEHYRIVQNREIHL